MVKPFTKGAIDAISADAPETARSEVPASVEIATAPMLIQYGGIRSDGAKRKKVYR